MLDNESFWGFMARFPFCLAGAWPIKLQLASASKNKNARRAVLRPEGV